MKEKGKDSGLKEDVEGELRNSSQASQCRRKIPTKEGQGKGFLFKGSVVHLT